MEILIVILILNSIISGTYSLLSVSKYVFMYMNSESETYNTEYEDSDKLNEHLNFLYFHIIASYLMGVIFLVPINLLINKYHKQNEKQSI